MAKIFEEIEAIKDRWFLFEPVLFMVVCTFPAIASKKTNNIMSGGRNIYVNVDFFEDKSSKIIEEYIMVECIRILLKHPFQRMLPSRAKAYISSNILIGNNFKFSKLRMPSMSEWRKMSYDDIYNHLPKNESTDSVTPFSMYGGDSDSVGNKQNPFPNDDDAVNNTQMWGEDEAAKGIISNIVGRAISSGEWGTIPSALRELIMADEPPTYNYKTAIRRFKRSVVDSGSMLTRMKPNRRYGYDQMGRKNSYISNLLLVCDTSGSMSNDDISKFCGFVNGFFSCGMASIDCIQFDTVVYDDTLTPIHKKLKCLTTESRGGTVIDDICEYVSHRSKKKYNGVIIFTDGCFGYDPSLWDKFSMKQRFCSV